MVELYYRTFGSGYPLIALHGLYASFDTWLPLVPHLKSDYQLILPDLRNHGRSPHTSEHTYPLMASDVALLMDRLAVEKAIVLGHSMGGKVAMQLANDRPERVRYLLVEDISPFSYLNHPAKSYHEHIVRSLLSLSLNERSGRKELEAALNSLLNDTTLTLFLLKNLERRENGAFWWRLNLHTIARSVANILAPLAIYEPLQTASLFIRGSASNYVLPKDEDAIKEIFPNAQFACIENGEHWLHGSSAAELVNIAKQHLSLLN